jgi:hypothetical protein
MPFPTEQERKIIEEIQLIDDPTQYNLPTTYGAAHSYGNIAIPKAGIIAVNLSLWEDYGVETYQLKASIGGIPVWSTGAAITKAGPSGGGVVANFHFLVYLNAGSYAVLVEGKSSALNKFRICNFKLGFGTFNDLIGTNLAAYGTTLTHNTPQRTTPIGTLTRTTLYIRVCATSAAAASNMENVGETLTNGVSITVDDAQVSWLERYQNNVADGQSASGLAVLSLTTGANHTVALTLRNAATAANITIICCPWILGTTPDYPKTQYKFPIDTLNFSPKSTLYVVLEAYSAVPSKFIAVGKSRLVSHGLTHDYYASETSADTLVFSYTFEIVDVSTICIVTDGLGGCISYIGVDLVA